MSTLLQFSDDFAGDLLAFLADRFSACFVLADSNTRPHAEPLAKALNAKLLVVPTGENHKNLQQAEKIWQQLLDAGADRRALLINLGGGMVTDLGGFVAAGYKRGIACIHVPSSLLAMVDAAHGGKTGINLGGVKNAIGHFYPADAIFIHAPLLNTLPLRELQSGKAEMFKHGLIGDAALWQQLVDLPADAIPAQHLIERAIALKTRIVAADPTEKGERKLLNLGHTFGHAFESYFMYSSTPWLHGEAIFAGMLVEARLAHRLGLLAAKHAAEIEEVLKPWQPAGKLPPLALILPWLLNDKKNHNHQVQFVLPTAIGSALYDQAVSVADLEKWYPQLMEG